MHLLEVRISGFKTFVDYTKIKINQDLVCVVGPNGCGKSNILDAIRWVLGESSNKLIRTTVNDDVIFNGAKGRAKSDRASVELIFDNSDKKITGAFEKFNQISIKRELFRDQPSKYSINQQKVRRKDVVNIFIGTGLGANSYALIQQGLVSQMVESKPDELREMIEEAAQISGYKQRRHETSLKIKNTRENLDRVNDLKTEISEQCRYLNNQAKAAKRFHKIKEQLLEQKFQSIAFEYQYLANEKKNHHSQSLELEAAIEKINAKLAKLESKKIANNEKIADLNQTKNELEKTRYEKGREIARLEERIKQIEQDLSTKDQRISQFKGEIAEIDQKLIEQNHHQSELEQAIEQIAQTIQEQEQAFNHHQGEFERMDANRQAHLLEMATVESKKANLDSHLKNKQISESQFNQNLSQQNEQLKKISAEIKAIDLSQLETSLKKSQLTAQSKEKSLIESREKQQKIAAKFEQIKAKHHNSEKKLSELNQQKAQISAKIRATEQIIVALEGESLSESKKQLQSADIKYALFSDQIAIDSNYQTLIGAVLPEIAAISLDDKEEKRALKWLDDKLAADEKIELEWFVLNQKNDHPIDPSESSNRQERLSQPNQRSSKEINLAPMIDFMHSEAIDFPEKLKSTLSQIFLSSDLATALSKRDLLTNQQSILINQGNQAVWLARDWLKVIDLKVQSSNSPVLARAQLKREQKNLQSIQSEINPLDKTLSQLKQQLETLSIEKNDAAELLEIEKTALNQTKQNLAHQQSELDWQTKRAEELIKAKQNLTQSIETNQLELEKLKQWNQEDESLALENKLSELKAKQITIDQALNEKKSAFEQCREQLQQNRQKLSNQKLQLQFVLESSERIKQEQQQKKSALENLLSDENQSQINKQKHYQQQLDDWLNQHQQEDEKIAHLNRQINRLSDLQTELEEKLEAKKERYYNIDKQKNTLEIAIRQIKANQNQCLDDLIRLDKNQSSSSDALKEQNQHSDESESDDRDDMSVADQQAIDLNNPIALEPENINQTENSANQSTLEERLVNLADQHLKADQVISKKTIETIKDQVDRLEMKLGKMGSVNLNAIVDYQKAQQKLDYLVSQSDDIEQALDTLKQAIDQIDQQTKHRFEITFNQINQSFGEYFPTLFGGGSAKLLLTENDWLTSGVIIDAKPYGKNNKQIGMLSGGEKALTAIALIFSFFNLNPAPFCLLDEVDAPLDDHNTEKFIDLIKQKSSDVQFICITHNKQTMQSGSQLLGVTMNEPGISRVVSVDIDKAMELTQSMVS